MTSIESERIPVLSEAGDALERLIATRAYRLFVGGLAAVLAVLFAVHAVRFVAGGSLGLAASTARALNLVTSVVVTAFVLAGVVQLLVFARGVRRRETVVATSAKTVEQSAGDVRKAAEELEDAVESPEAGDADGIETRVEQAEAQATEAQETVEEVRSELDHAEDDRTNRD